MTACVFSNINSKIDSIIENGDAKFYIKPSKFISINDYIKNCDDTEEAENNIKKLIDKLYSSNDENEINKEIENPVEKTEEKESIEKEDIYNDKIFVPRLTTEQFFRKLAENERNNQYIKRSRKIHSWYRTYRIELDELFFMTYNSFSDNNIEFSVDKQTMYDDFIEFMYDKYN